MQFIVGILQFLFRGFRLGNIYHRTNHPVRRSFTIQKDSTLIQDNRIGSIFFLKTEAFRPVFSTIVYSRINTIGNPFPVIMMNMADPESTCQFMFMFLKTKIVVEAFTPPYPVVYQV